MKVGQKVQVGTCSGKVAAIKGDDVTVLIDMVLEPTPARIELPYPVIKPMKEVKEV